MSMWAKVINVYIYHRFHYENMTWDSNQNVLAGLQYLTHSNL